MNPAISELQDDAVDALRREVSNNHARGHPRRFKLRQATFAVRRRLPRPGLLVLLTMAIGSSISAALILIWRWPPGGGTVVSELAVAQGAGLVFVVLLLSLVPAAVEAGRRIGWEPTWILRDRRTWAGFALVGLLSLGELTIAWRKPDHAEEGATILMSATGIAITGMLAWRLLRLSDPAEQFAERIRSQLPKLSKRMRRERQRLGQRAREQGRSTEEIRLLELTPHPAIQSSMAGLLRPMFGFVLRLVSEGRLDQAQQVHGSIVQTVASYVAEGRRVALKDPVVEVFADRTNEVHALVGGAHGRDLSTSLLNGFSTVAQAIGTSHLKHNVREGAALHRLAFTTKFMMDRRRDDPFSPDAAHALRVMDELAAIAAQVGDGPSAVAIGEPVAETALSASRNAEPHLARPAWTACFRLLAVLLRVEDPLRDEIAIDMWAERLAKHVAGVPTVPNPGMLSGAEPIFGVAGDEVSLTMVAYILWGSLIPAETKVLLDLQLGAALAAPLAGTDGDDRAWAVEVVTGLWHEMGCAAASAAAANPHLRGAALVAIAAKLAALREVWVAEHQLGTEALHRYVTAWVVGLSITARGQSLPPALRDELTAFEIAVAHIASNRPAGLPEAATWLRTALGRAGHTALADRLGTLPVGTHISAHGELAGIGGGRRLYRGSTGDKLVGAAEHWWLGG